MISYTCLGTNDLEKGAAFYDELLALVGAGRASEMDRLITWASAAGAPMFALNAPYDGKPATVGNGVMVALWMDSTEQTDAVYKKAIELGAQCEGEPGYRLESDTFYAAYFRDLDGNKLCACHFKS